MASDVRFSLGYWPVPECYKVPDRLADHHKQFNAITSSPLPKYMKLYHFV